MEKGKALSAIADSVTKLDLHTGSNSKPINTSIGTSNPQFSRKAWEKRRPPGLVSLCLGVIGKHLEDIILDLDEISGNFPADIKMAMAAIARRRKLLNDEVIVSLADSSWEFLDISGSDVSDIGLKKVAEICKFLRAVDISQCSKITTAGVSELVRHCHSLEILRCGGCPRSDYTARRCLGVFKPKLHDMEGDSWEELDTAEIVNGAESLRWLVWPKVDKGTLESFSTECPRIIVNPKPSPFGFRGTKVPREAFPDIALDDPIVEDIDPKTWVLHGSIPKATPPLLSSNGELSVAEKFRLAFEERDTRLAPKRAKNARQHQRRAEREWMMMNARAKALALASQASKSLHSRSLALALASQASKSLHSRS
ncbi:LRR domain containing protein [Parasponia andersonii]|uniref:LRR domain containing protein n=1 Tax=Parasponia andersonii TaxID=3476 RepID=A0A2P5BRS1_PARAD|nr:LRR domain containing protein [Parasponia andersonii]